MPNIFGWKLLGDRQKPQTSAPVMSKEVAQRKLANALHLMVDRPDGIADISSCALSVIPRDFFHQCVTYVKTDVIISDNQIKDMESGGAVGNLRRIKSFDCHSNVLERIPAKFGECFPSLVVLDLSDNRLTCLPDSFVNLKLLKVLKIARNRFQDFPQQINRSAALEELDLAGNGITTLPRDFGRLRCLKTLSLDVEKMIYPEKSICEEGTLAVFAHLRKDMGTEFSDDSGCFCGSETDTFSVTSPGAETVNRYITEDVKMKDAIRRYNNDDGIKRTEMLRFNAALDEDHLQVATNVYKGKASEQKALLLMMKEQEKTGAYLQALTTSVEKGKKGLDEALHEMEIHSQRLLIQLTAMSDERAKQFRSYETDVRKDDLVWRNLHVQLEASKKQQILSAMKFQLADTKKSDAFYKHLMSIAKMNVDNIVNMHRAEERRYVPLVNKAKVEQDNMINSLLQDERVQQEVFRQLQLKTDFTHQRIMRDMVLLEHELTALSVLEQKQRDQNLVIAKNCVEDERMKLAKLYQKLLKELEQREVELRSVMRDMEKEAVKHEENFWLVQYDRLMEALPASLLDSNVVKAQKAKNPTGPSSQAASTSNAPSSSLEIKTAVSVPPVLHLETTCIICMDRLSTSVFLPCGHICCCSPCGDLVKDCPLCRTTISQKLTLKQSPE